ncbi:serine hydrolase [Acuticoccus kandeliae]|uniref:serine hydrolase n=1 Tax=Acuticoccus kandeliae TaxID=2073160 RepID=UPI000D3EC805|nr:serine hydrolase [Acuticoccus kandeliae]
MRPKYEKQRYIFRYGAALGLSVLLGGAALADEAADARITSAVDALDGIVTRIMERSHVPGIAVAVVHDGTMIYAKGFGVRELGKDGAVGADTVFQIASLSKSLASSVVARQVSEGKVSWTTPVKTLLPTFDLADPWVGAHVTVGDLFSHRSGLPDHAGDDLEDIGFDRATIIERLRTFPLDPFRISYAYTNYGLTTGAEAVAEAVGTEWETLSDEALYKPLGMTSTSSRLADFLAHEDRAVGHVRVDGAFAALAQRAPDPQSPAGGVSSTVEDFSRWMIMVLANGKLDGEAFIKEKALLPAVTPQSVSRASDSMAALPSFYGYGIGVGTHGPGPVVLSHSGAFQLGTGTNYMMLPSQNLGIVTFSNGAPVGAVEAIGAEFMDLAIDGETTNDWLAIIGPHLTPMLEPIGSLVGKTAPADAAPAAPLTDYAGDFTNDYFGPAKVADTDGALVLTLGPAGQTYDLTHWSGDVFSFPVFNESMPKGSISALTFKRDGDAVSALTVEFLDADGTATFQRAAN